MIGNEAGPLLILVHVSSQQKLILRQIEGRYFSLKTVFENLNLVKSYDKTNPNDSVFGLGGA